MRRHILSVAGLRESTVLLKSLVTWFTARRSTALGRRHLLELNDRMLRDIGLTRHEIVHGAGRWNNAGHEVR